jgi:hypothetical protein
VPMAWSYTWRILTPAGSVPQAIPVDATPGRTHEDLCAAVMQTALRHHGCQVN